MRFSWSRSSSWRQFLIWLQRVNVCDVSTESFAHSLSSTLNPWELINGKLNNIPVLKLHIFDIALYILYTYWNWLSLSGLVEVNGVEGMVLMGGEMTQNGMTDDKVQIWREIMFMLWGMTNTESAETVQR